MKQTEYINGYNKKFIMTNCQTLSKDRERKVAIYARVSTEHEEQISALDNQIKWYDEQVKLHSNWTLYERYVDEGITGTQAKKRPSFLKMLEDAKDGKFDLIITREVCRFARNVVDTLVATRELQSIGVEVYFIQDNIWTMDGDGELRLSLMSTLAQEESRKISERVRAGMITCRSKGVVLGSGNILGYDRKNGTYVINEEQAETVRMIFDLYLKGYGGYKIANILTERLRKTATGVVKWSNTAVLRIVQNETYTGKAPYNKSITNNYLEQKRIVNLDAETHDYRPGNFEAIISEEDFITAQKIRRGKKAYQRKFDTSQYLFVSLDDNVWKRKLICSCGSKFHRNIWHIKNNGEKSYGYACLNRLSNGSKSKREQLGLDSKGFCNSRRVAEWKLYAMAAKLFDDLWTDRRQDILLETLNIIQSNYQSECKFGQNYLSKLENEKINIENKLTNLIMMRTNKEVTMTEYEMTRNEFRKCLEKVQQEIDECMSKEKDDFLDIDKIKQTVTSLMDVKTNRIDDELIELFVDKIIKVDDNTFEWYLNTGINNMSNAKVSIEGTKKQHCINLEEIDTISSLHSYVLEKIGSTEYSDPCCHYDCDVCFTICSGCDSMWNNTRVLALWISIASCITCIKSHRMGICRGNLFTQTSRYIK